MRISRKAVLTLVLFGVGLALPASYLAQTRNIEVDFSKTMGTIKPLNGVNGGPIVTRGAFDLSKYFVDLGIKHIRLHDVPWYYEDAVDINYVFPRDGADVNDPQNYDFFLTDYYLKSIRALGADVTFRCGYSAEWEYHPLIHNAPPKDYAKWASVCGHIVQHYNDGWDNGFHYNIKYWEIWNEPDGKSFWSGTPEEYYKLYEVTARTLKKLDPTLKVGGPTLASRLPFLEGFLKYCQHDNVPMDFVSWHIYAPTPGDVFSKAGAVQELMTKYGYGKSESVLDEWNYFAADWHSQEVDGEYRRNLFARQMGGPSGAAFDASVLIDLQDSSVAIADFYQGTNMFWGGLFDEYGVPYKNYYTFKAFRILLETPQRVAIPTSDHKGFAALAGVSSQKSEAAVLISNFGTQDRHYSVSLRNLPWNRPSVFEQYAVDSHHNLDLVKSGKLSGESILLDVEAPSVCLLRIKAGQ